MRDGQNTPGGERSQSEQRGPRLRAFADGAEVSEPSREALELPREVRLVPGNGCDELEVLELEARSYAAPHQGKVSEAPGSLPEPLADDRNGLVILFRMAEHAVHHRARSWVIREKLERRPLVSARSHPPPRRASG